MTNSWSRFDEREQSMSKKTKREKKTGYRHVSFQDYNWLNEDEALEYVILRATERGWKFFGWYDRQKYPEKMQFYVFGGEIFVYFVPENTHETVEMATYTIENLIIDEEFMECYYGNRYFSPAVFLEHSSECHEIVRRIGYNFHEQLFQVQMKEIEFWDDKLQWLFANIDM